MFAGQYWLNWTHPPPNKHSIGTRLNFNRCIFTVIYCHLVVCFDRTAYPFGSNGLLVIMAIKDQQLFKSWQTGARWTTSVYKPVPVETCKTGYPVIYISRAYWKLESTITDPIMWSIIESQWATKCVISNLVTACIICFKLTMAY